MKKERVLKTIDIVRVCIATYEYNGFLIELFQENKLEEARAIQKEANVIIRALCKVGVMQGEKAVMDALGFEMGTARAPFGPLTDEQKKELLDVVLPLL